MDISVNKPAKDFLKQHFKDWYAQQLTNQLDDLDIESADLQPISLNLPLLKKLGAKWMVEMVEYLAKIFKSW